MVISLLSLKMIVYVGVYGRVSACVVKDVYSYPGMMLVIIISLERELNLFSHVDRRGGGGGDRQKNVNCPDVNWRMKYGCTLHTRILPNMQMNTPNYPSDEEGLRKTFRHSFPDCE